MNLSLTAYAHTSLRTPTNLPAVFFLLLEKHHRALCYERKLSGRSSDQYLCSFCFLPHSIRLDSFH